MQDKPRYHIVAMDFGAKLNILRCLAAVGCKVTVVPAQTSADDILALKPDGVFLSNGGDPAATGVYAVPTIQALLSKIFRFWNLSGASNVGLGVGWKNYQNGFGGIAGRTTLSKISKQGVWKLPPQNHGFTSCRIACPKRLKPHISLFDKTNEGIRSLDKPAFSVQYHPEASPGRWIAIICLTGFIDMIADHKKKVAA